MIMPLVIFGIVFKYSFSGLLFLFLLNSKHFSHFNYLNLNENIYIFFLMSFKNVLASLVIYVVKSSVNFR